MLLTIEESQNGNLWNYCTLSESKLRFVRVINTFQAGDTALSIGSIVMQSKTNQRLEYSSNRTDWYPMRIAMVNPMDTGFLVLNAMHRGQFVRTVEIIDKTKTDDTAPKGGIFEKARQSETEMSDQAKEHIREADQNILVYADSGRIDFTVSPSVTGGSNKNRRLICQIKNTNVYKMTVPNRTSVEVIDANWPAAIQQGFVFRLDANFHAEKTHLSQLSGYWGKEITPNDLIGVQSARNYDAEAYKFFGQIKTATILNGKYQVTTTNYTKLGSMWYILKEDVPAFLNAVRNIDGVVNDIYLPDVYQPATRKDIKEVVDLYRLLEQKLADDSVNGHTMEATSETLAMAIRYRAAVAKQLASLDISIDNAKEYLAERVASETVSRFQTTP